MGRNSDGEEVCVHSAPSSNHIVLARSLSARRAVQLYTRTRPLPPADSEISIRSAGSGARVLLGIPCSTRLPLIMTPRSPYTRAAAASYWHAGRAMPIHPPYGARRNRSSVALYNYIIGDLRGEFPLQFPTILLSMEKVVWPSKYETGGLDT